MSQTQSTRKFVTVASVAVIVAALSGCSSFGGKSSSEVFTATPAAQRSKRLVKESR